MYMVYIYTYMHVDMCTVISMIDIHGIRRYIIDIYGIRTYTRYTYPHPCRCVRVPYISIDIHGTHIHIRVDVYVYHTHL